MPSSAVRVFSDPDEYAATIRGGAVELTVTGRGDFTAKLTRIDLHRLWMQRFCENLPRIVDATNHITGRVFLSFRTQPGPALLQGGIAMEPSTLILHGPGTDYYHRSSGPADFATAAG